MNIIFFSRREGRARQFDLGHPMTLGVIGVLALAILSTAFALGIQLGKSSGSRRGGTPTAIADLLLTERTEVNALKAQLQDRIDAVAVRIGQMNAHVIRLDALGKRLMQMASINSREFNFDSEPPVGGPEEPADGNAGASAQIPDVTMLLDTLEQRMQQRDVQLAALENALLSRDLTDAVHPEGRPVEQGFISSYFGERQDPFTGHEANHRGMDFAGSSGSRVQAVAAGIVTWSDNQPGYGSMVEINHGNGYTTRYGHNQRNLVNVGQTVKRGEAIALMGSTGRSTGPHVHFEVLKNGKQVNPVTFISQQK